MARGLVEAGLDILVACADGADQEVYVQYRRRGDQAYLDVVPPPEKKRPLYDDLLSGMAPWSCQKFQLLARKPAGDSEVWIAVHLEVLVDGQTQTLDDAALLQLLDGQWFVAELPS